MEILDSHAPYRILSIKEIKWSQKPWITKGIKKSIIGKNIYYGKFLRTKNKKWYDKYKYYRINIKKLTRISKKTFYTKYFTEYEANSKKIWNGINTMLHKNEKDTIGDIFLNENGQIITDQGKVANSFNKFYKTIAQKLVNNLGDTNNIFQDYLKNPNEHSIFLNEINPNEVFKILAGLDPTKASDIYGIPPKILKTTSRSLCTNLTMIFNKSLKLGVFPDALKLTKVIPIHKANSKMIVSNYRPISLIPLFSKVFEKLMHKRIMDFLIKQNILSKKQYGFQKNKSTEHAILDMQSKIIDAIEKREKSCCIFVDFAKAFDTGNHSILIQKLNYYGIRGATLNWLQSYISNRQQCVQIGNSQSDFMNTDCGVPQGSVLGPLLFLIYINDIAESSQLLVFHLFADDTSIFFKHKDVSQMEEILNTELEKVSNWLIANKLSLNVSKSNVLVFRSKSANSDKILNLKINGQSLEENTYAKYLGVYIDHKLTWHHQTVHVNSKLIKGNAILAKLRHYVPGKVMKNLYNALIQPHLDYGALIWGKANEIHVKKIRSSLNKTMRIISFKNQQKMSNCSTQITKFSHLKVIWNFCREN